MLDREEAWITLNLQNTKEGNKTVVFLEYRKGDGLC